MFLWQIYLQYRYQILLESVQFYRRYDENILAYFALGLGFSQSTASSFTR